MVDVTPGDSGANKGFWRKQLRDRFGKFVDMGGSVIFDVKLPGFTGIARAKGVFRGMLDLDTARIEVLDNSQIPKGVYLIDRKYIEAVREKARLPGKLVGKPDLEPIQAPTLKSKISGTDAMKIRYKSVSKILKDKGRFPLPRQGTFDEVGKTSDVAEGAKIDYKKVFDAEPELQAKFKTPEALWDYVTQTAADFTTQSPNDLNDIPSDMKMLNRAYAKHILGMDPDGLITVYRNAVNNKYEEEESAVGYVSLDRQMAWDYNSTRENAYTNGSYEIDVKPDEVYGMLGYSQLEDEYSVTIGRGVTQQEGRVRRVKDLEPAVLPDWLQTWNRKEFNRLQGGSPFRAFGLAGEYDFHEVEDFGEDLTAFLKKYNLQASDISALFDKLYGDGAYAKYKESGNIVTYGLIRKMFVTLDNGNLGLNVPAIAKFQVPKSNEEYVGDQFDNLMKMLSVFQELTGQHFMTHKTRDYTAPESSNQTGVFKEYSPDNSSNAAEDTRLTDLGFDPEEEITVYRGIPTDAEDGINSGDWVTTIPQLAKDYAGGGKVVSMKVKAKDLLTDPSSGEDAYTEEMVYRPK